MTELDTFTLPSDQDATGRSFGDDEMALLAEVIRSGTLTSTKGTVRARPGDAASPESLGAAPRLRLRLGHGGAPHRGGGHRPRAGRRDRHHADHRHGRPHADPLPGRHPGLRRRRPATCNVTAATHRTRRSPPAPRPSSSPTCSATRATWARSWSSPAAAASRSSRTARRRSWRSDRRPARSGRIGALGCFSLQQGKHITTGEGGLVVTDDDALARRMFLFINKAWGYGDADPGPLLPRPQLPDERAAGGGGAGPARKLPDVRRAAHRQCRPAERQRSPTCRGSRRRAVAPAASTPTGSTACGSTPGSCPAAPWRSAPACGGGASPRRRATSRSRRSSARSSATSAPSAPAAGRSRLARPEAVDYRPRAVPRRLRRPGQHPGAALERAVRAGARRLPRRGDSRRRRPSWPRGGGMSSPVAVRPGRGRRHRRRPTPRR